MDFNAILSQAAQTELLKARALIRLQAWNDYPRFDLAYQHDPDYNQAYSDAYNAEQDAKEQRRLTDERYPRSAEIDRRNGL